MPNACCYAQKVIRWTIGIKDHSEARFGTVEIWLETVLVLAAVVTLAVGGSIPSKPDVELKTVDATFIERQKRVLNLLQTIGQYRKDAVWFKIGSEYNIEANIDNYTDKKAVEEFLLYFKRGYMPKYKTFSVLYDDMREEAIAIFKILFYAKDFETFYKTATFARVHCNDGQFLYAYYTAIYQRHDTNSLILPAPYEMFPQYFASIKSILKAYRMKMQKNDVDLAYASQHGIFNENDDVIIYSNYTDPSITGSVEDRLSYFTEDIGMNSYYYYFQILYPFWWNKNTIIDTDETRADFIYNTYQQIIAKYYLNRLSSGIGEIPKLSWHVPVETGYYCDLSTYYPFFSRNDYYQINKNENAKYIQFLEYYEKAFLDYADQGSFKASNKKFDVRDPKAMEFVSKYWFTTVDLFEKLPGNYERYYENVARHILAGTPEPVDKYTIMPSALELYQTSLRDPVFYQFYARILNFIMQWKEYLEPYNYSQLHYTGVKISDVKIEKMVTFFEFYDFGITNDMFHTIEEFKANDPTIYKVRQPRLNHKPFSVNIDVKSDITADSVIKIFLGPKYDSNGYPITIEDNWMNFIQLDWFIQTLMPGQNKIKRRSTDFSMFKDDSTLIVELYELFKQGKIPVDMAEKFYLQPRRLMLPKGTKGGFPFQIYVVVYPHNPLPSEIEEYQSFIPDTKPFSYPFDRPIHGLYFKQPNIFQEDIYIYHEGEKIANIYNVKNYYPTYKSQVPKH